VKKILFIINSIKYKSGIEKVACTLSNALNGKGYKIYISNRDTSFEEVAFSLHKGVDVLKFNGSPFVFFVKVYKFIMDNDIDYVIVHNMGKLSILFSALNFIKKCKIISLEHVAFMSRPFYIRTIYYFLSRFYSRIVTLTKNDASFYNKFLKQVTVINNFFTNDSENVEYNTKSSKVVAIGRLTYQKNFDSLLNIWKSIILKNPDWILEIYGDGDDYDKLLCRINDEKIVNVFLKGSVDNVADIYKSASIFVMTSRYEGLPMVLLEAQAYGLPIVSYNCPFGPSEVVLNNKSGYLVDDFNEYDFIENLNELMKSASLRSYMSDNAMKNSTKFTQDHIVNKWIDEVLT